MRVKLAQVVRHLLIILSLSVSINLSASAAGLNFIDFSELNNSAQPLERPQEQPAEQFPEQVESESHNHQNEATSGGLVFQDFNNFSAVKENTTPAPTATDIRIPGQNPPQGVGAVQCRYGYSQELGRCQTKSEAEGLSRPTGQAIACGSAPVCAKFNAALSKCGCQLGPPRITHSRRGGKSCHNSGAAIDVMSIVCDGTKYNGYSKRYMEWHACMTPTRKNSRGTYSGNGLISLYQQHHKRGQVGDTQAHFDHAHFSIGCNGGTYW